MSEDKLKDWIREERDQFEAEVPREGIWEDIEAQVHGSSQPRKRGWFKFSVAAAIAALIALTLIYQFTSPDLTDQLTQQDDSQSQETFQRLSDEMQETQSFYANRVNERMSQLSKYPVDADLKEAMDMLTNEFEMLQSEMGQGLDDSKVVEAMIDNYRLRLDLLEDLLKALDRQPRGIEKTINEGNEI